MKRALRNPDFIAEQLARWSNRDTGQKTKIPFEASFSCILNRNKPGPMSPRHTASGVVRPGSDGMISGILPLSR
jgi:hypothetical protein